MLYRIASAFPVSQGRRPARCVGVRVGGGGGFRLGRGGEVALVLLLKTTGYSVGKFRKETNTRMKSSKQHNVWRQALPA